MVLEGALSVAPVLTCVIAGVLGGAVGSFAHTFAEAQGAALWRRSHCNGCGRLLTMLELVPVLSWLGLLGNCRTCRARIPWRYPVIEAVSALVFVLAAVAATSAPQLLAGWIAATVLLLTFLTDHAYQEVSPALLLVGALLVGGLGYVAGMPLPALLIGAVVGGGIFAAQHVVSRGRWVGLGDAWIGVFLGALLGWPKVLLAIALAYIGGAVVALTLLARKTLTKESRIAFGTFLAVAGMGTWLWGDAVLAAYWRLAASLVP